MNELPDDREQFVIEILPYVKYLAHRIAVGLPPCVDLNDLVNYGVLGLLDACQKFDESKGVKFKSYAETRIRGAILDGMRAGDWVPRSVRRKRRELESAYRQVESNLGRKATDKEVANHMNMGVEKFRLLVHDVQRISLASLEELTTGDEDGLQDLSDTDPQVLVEREQLRARVGHAVAQLPEKERLICSLYYCDELTMKEIGLALGIGESWACKLHLKAMESVREALQALLT